MGSLCVYMCLYMDVYWRWKGCNIPDITTLVSTIFWHSTFIYLPESQRKVQFDAKEE